jgi:hypothetical protein
MQEGRFIFENTLLDVLVATLGRETWHLLSPHLQEKRTARLGVLS